MSTATPDRPDRNEKPGRWKLELYGGPLDGLVMGVTPVQLAEITRRGFIVMCPNPVDEPGRVYTYCRARDGKYRFTRKVAA